MPYPTPLAKGAIEPELITPEPPIPAAIHTSSLPPPPITSLVVFLSSTALDLQPYRDALAKRLGASRFFKCFRHEDAGPADMTPVDFCRAAVYRSHIYVGLIGLRRGFEPDGRQSITEMELNWAGECRIPRLIWLAPDDFTGHPAAAEPDPARQRQQAFRERIKLNLIVSTSGFDSPHQLALEVENHLLAHLIARQHARTGEHPATNFVETELASAIGQAAANDNFDLNSLAEHPEKFDPGELLHNIGRHAGFLEIKLRADPGLYPSLKSELAGCFREMAALATIARPHNARLFFEKALEYDPDHIPTRIAYGDWLDQTGDVANAEKHYLLARQKAQKSRQAALEAQALYSHATLIKRQGHYKRARRILERLVPYFANTNDLRSLADAHDVLAAILLQLGKLTEAEQLLRKAERLYQTLGANESLSEVYNSFAALYEHQDDRARQKMYLLKAHDLALKGTSALALVNAYDELATYALHNENPEDCACYIERAYALAQEHQLQSKLANILKTKAGFSHSKGQSQDAIGYLEQARELEFLQGQHQAAASTQADLASIYIDLKEFGIAEDLLRKTLAAAGGFETCEPRMRTLAYLGDLETARANQKHARAYYQQSLAVANRLQDQYLIGELKQRLNQTQQSQAALKVKRYIESLPKMLYKIVILSWFKLCLKKQEHSKKAKNDSG